MIRVAVAAAVVLTVAAIAVVAANALGIVTVGGQR